MRTKELCSLEGTVEKQTAQNLEYSQKVQADSVLYEEAVEQNSILKS